MSQLVNTTTGRPDLYGHLPQSPSQVRRRIRRLWRDDFAKSMPAAPMVEWTRTPRVAPKPAPSIDIDALFADRREYRFKYPAGRKAMDTLRGRGLEPSSRDVKQMRAHRKSSMNGGA